MKPEGFEEGMLVMSYQGIADEVFFRVFQWDKRHPVLMQFEGEDYFWHLQVIDLQDGEAYWLRNYPGWSIVTDEERLRKYPMPLHYHIAAERRYTRMFNSILSEYGGIPESFEDEV